MIKILQIGMSDNLGGIEVYLINLLRNIDKDKFQIDFLKMNDNELCFENEIRNNYNSRIIPICNYIKFPLKFVRSLKKIINDNNYDIVYLNKNSLAIPLQLFAAEKSNVNNIIIHSHSTNSNNKTIGNILHKINKHLFLKKKYYYFSCSKLASDWFFTKKIIQSSNHYIINNSIDMSKFVYNESIRKKIREEYKIDDNTMILGHVGRFVRAKNHDFLIDIFENYHKKNKNSMLWLIGIGELQDKIIEKVEALGLSEYVVFFNKRDDVNSLLNAMDCFVFPSIYEGLPLTVIEAQATGIKCLLSNNIDHESKILSTTQFISSTNCDDWSDSISKNNDRLTLSKEALETKFNIKNEIKKIEIIFKNINNKGVSENEKRKNKKI